MRLPNGYWTKERCMEEVKKYTTKKDFYTLSKSAYQSAYHNGWLSEITERLEGIKMNFFIHKENCIEEALKYKTITEFIKKSPGAYKSASKNGWIDEITGHMTHMGDKYKRCIYSYEFDDNSVYIGLTYNLEKRDTLHKSNLKSTVNIHINKTGIVPKLVKLTDYIDVEEAIKMEFYFLNRYKNNGYIILNKVKTGGLGRENKWTKENCLELALKCETLKDFYEKYEGAYTKSIKEGWLNLFTHLKISKLPNGYWTKEKCLEESLKYKSKKDFRINSKSAYSSATKNKWLDEICIHYNLKII